MKLSKFTLSLLLTSSVAMLTACGGNSSGNSRTVSGTTTPTTPTNPSTPITGDVTPSNIERAIPAALGSVYTAANKFNRYIKYTAPNGKPIHIVAQDQLTDE